MSKKVQIGIKKFREKAIMPTKSTPLSNGYDIYAIVDNPFNQLWIEPFETVVINTGLNIELPKGWYAYIQSRSGLAAKQSMFTLNSPGLIDSSYSGNGENFELKVILHNAKNIPQYISHGDRIAQMTIHKEPEHELVELDREVISHQDGRTGGLGSTGK